MLRQTTCSTLVSPGSARPSDGTKGKANTRPSPLTARLRFSLKEEEAAVEEPAEVLDPDLLPLLGSLVPVYSTPACNPGTLSRVRASCGSG